MQTANMNLSGIHLENFSSAQFGRKQHLHLAMTPQAIHTGFPERKNEKGPGD